MIQAATKKLSQNFIMDPRLLDRFARLSSPGGKLVVEVGPGPGQREYTETHRLLFIRVLLCYVMLCYVMLCYVMLCYVHLTQRPGSRQ